MADLNESEVEHVQNLEKQFGFSEEEALLMLGVYRGLKINTLWNQKKI